MLVLLALTACGGDDRPEQAATEAPPSAEARTPAAAEPPAPAPPPPAPEPPPPAPEPPPPAPEPPPPVEPDPAPPEGASDEEAGFTTPTGVECTGREPEPVDERPTFDAPPELQIEDGVTYTATMETSCGTIVLELDTERAPITSNNFITLARAGFFDGLSFHRAVPGFVIQGGDPLGDGTGGPGYQFEDELPDGVYELGDLAMANAGPNTNGSQFFIVTGDASFLPSQFSKFGNVTEGLEVAQGIESLGDASTQVPAEPVYMFSVEITES